MLIYTIILILTVIGCIFFEKKNIIKGLYLYLIIFLVTSITMGLFNPLGGDLLVYQTWFEDWPTFNNLRITDLEIGVRHQPLWVIFNAFTKFINNNFTTYLLIHTFLINSVIFYTIYRLTEYKFTTLLIFFTSMQFFFFDLELQRESLAVCVGLLSIKYYSKAKFLQYYLGCIIAFLFHISAIFLFILPIIFYLLRFKNKWYFFIIFIGLILGLSSIGYYINLFSYFEFTQGIISQYEHYDSLSANSLNIILSTIFNIIPPLGMIIISKLIKFKRHYLINCAYIFLIINICNPFVNAIWRFNDYIIIQYYIFLAEIVRNKLAVKQFKMLIIGVFMFFYANIGYLWSRPLSHFDGKIKYYELFIPYRCIINK